MAGASAGGYDCFMWQCSKRDPSRSSLAAHCVTLATTPHSYHSSISCVSSLSDTPCAHRHCIHSQPTTWVILPSSKLQHLPPAQPLLPQHQPKLREVSATSPDTQLSHTLHPYLVLTGLKASSLHDVCLSSTCLSLNFNIF